MKILLSQPTMLLEIFLFNLLHIAHSVQRVEYSLLRGATKYEVCDHSNYLSNYIFYCCLVQLSLTKDTTAPTPEAASPRHHGTGACDVTADTNTCNYTYYYLNYITLLSITHTIQVPNYPTG